MRDGIWITLFVIALIVYIVANPVRYNQVLSIGQSVGDSLQSSPSLNQTGFERRISPSKRSACESRFFEKMRAGLSFDRTRSNITLMINQTRSFSSLSQVADYFNEQTERTMRPNNLYGGNEDSFEESCPHLDGPYPPESFEVVLGTGYYLKDDEWRSERLSYPCEVINSEATDLSHRQCVQIAE